MEGTVTMKLEDFLKLKEKAAEKDYYTELTFEQIKLIEKVEEFLKVEEIETELIGEISEALEVWYG